MAMKINNFLILMYITAGLVETVFAEKSSLEDWIRQGEDFMRHSLYSIAAKCFGIAGETERRKVALAHAQAVKVCIHDVSNPFQHVVHFDSSAVDDF